MRTILFSPQFAPLVLAGLKNCTIRRHRDDRPVAVGERMSLRAWSGLPYRSKQIRLRDVVITSTTNVVMVWDSDYESGPVVHLDRRQADWDTVKRIAREDGFTDVTQFIDWFLPDREQSCFYGLIIRWKPTLLPPIQ